jgi:hypothetical protein
MSVPHAPGSAWPNLGPGGSTRETTSTLAITGTVPTNVDQVLSCEGNGFPLISFVLVGEVVFGPRGSIGILARQLRNWIC